MIVIGLLALPVAGQPNAATSGKNTSTNKETSPIAGEHDKSAADAANKTDDDPPRWYTAFERPDWWIVIIAAFTGAAVVYQAKEMTKATRVMRDQGTLMKRQADLMDRQAVLMERQARLQEAAMTQWVGVQGWKVSRIRTSGTLPRPDRLQINFDLSNESRFPLTMEAEFRFRFDKVTGDHTFRTGENIVLLPRNPYQVSIEMDLTEAQAEAFTERSPQIEVGGVISHVGVAKNTAPLMAIRGTLVCRANARARFEYGTIAMIQKESQPDGQNPN